MHQESWSKVSVVLFDRQIAHLDGNIRAKSVGRSLNRAEIIRALIDALIESGIDIGFSSEIKDVFKMSNLLGSRNHSWPEQVVIKVKYDPHLFLIRPLLLR